MNVKINLLKLIIQIKYRSSCFESKIIQWSFIGHWSGYIVSNCEHACILTQDGWGRPILTELMIFDQNLNFNRVTIIIIRIFYKLIWWFPQIFSQCHETFLILKVTDLRCLLKEMACVRILADVGQTWDAIWGLHYALCLSAFCISCKTSSCDWNWYFDTDLFLSKMPEICNFQNKVRFKLLGKYHKKH